jgi:DNA-binding response OmpR family regulator
VLVAEDDRDRADRYAGYLRDRYEVDVAYSGEQAVGTVSVAYDAVLLDRQLPDVSGEEVLATMADRGIDCRVVLLTAGDRGVDATDPGVDDCLVTPVTRREVRATVDRLLAVDEYSDRLDELRSKKLERNLLAVETTRAAPADSPEFERLTAEIARLEAAVERMADDLDADDRRSV